MKKLLYFLCLAVSTFAFAQSKLKVVEAGNEKPVAGASVFCNKKLIGKTNYEGILNFKTKCRKVDVKAPGYYEDEVVVDRVIEVSLAKADPKTQTIETVLINDNSDPLALAILKKVNENYKNNSPQSLDSYSFKSYEKISLDLDEDSIKDYNAYLQRRLDSLSALPAPLVTAEKKKDSLENVNVLKLMSESKLFLWERASEFLYSEKYGEKINILDNRVAGLKDPIYEMMTLRSNRNTVPREIREENRSLYRYFLTDSIDIDGRKNYVIRFRQVDYKQPVNKRRFNGYIYVDAETYGLKKLESNSKKKSEGSITSIWKPMNGKWFLSKENLKIKMGSTVFNKKKNDANEAGTKQKFGNYVYMMADYFDFKSPIDVHSKDFSGYTMSVQNADGKSLNAFRTDSLSAREKLSYEKIDSVGKKYKLDQKISGFTGLIRGKFRAGQVDFDLSQVLKYNLYEGARLGIAAKLNERFHPYISPDAYFAYGFKDHNWKYGAGVDVKTTLNKNSYFRAEYYHDVMAAGRFSEYLWNFRMKIMNAGIDLKNDRFYKYEGFKVSFEHDLNNDLTLRASAKKDSEESAFDYDYMQRGAAFNNFATQLTLKYSPRSKNIMTPAGKFTYEQNYPEFFFNYEQGLNALGGDLQYSRFDALAQHSIKSKLGVTGLRLYGGLVTGETPIWHHFTMNGLGAGDGSGFNYNLTSYLGFATMESGKYFNDKFTGFYITHRIPWYFRTFGKTTSSFDLIYKGVSGDMKNPEQHNFEFQKLNHLYQEVGFEVNHFLGTPFNLGFFYRVGYYATDIFKENFAVQLKLNVLGF